MMREIKFKGKGIDNGMWFYGYYYKDYHGRCYIIQDYGVQLEVLKETVKQYIGIKDKNGKEIYEGDTVRYTRESICIRKEPENLVRDGYIFWDDKAKKFQFRYIFESGGAYSSDVTFYDNRAWKNYVEVIGNIHEI